MFDLKRNSKVLKLIKSKKAKRVLIQVPEGLKIGVGNLIDFLEKNGLEVMLSVEPCFGGCDLRDNEAKELGCDLLLHIGHKDLGLKTKPPVVYYEYFMDSDFVPLLRKFLKKLKFRKICLVTTIQFAKNLDSAKRFLEKNGFKIYLGKDILGCDVSNAKRFEGISECYLFIGSGRFHPLGLQERTSKPVLFLDIEKRALEDLSKEKNKLEVKKEMRIQKAGGLRNFGIIISTKKGQLRLKTAENVKKTLKKRGKNVYMLVCDQLIPEKLLGLEIDVLVNTACPRIREDCEQFRKVILNPEDVESL
ncbi:MAG: diphthamide biosynthesis enzyme Dph2 [Candidatus Aenigmarchaeota archaeon]